MFFDAQEINDPIYINVEMKVWHCFNLFKNTKCIITFKAKLAMKKIICMKNDIFFKHLQSGKIFICLKPVKYTSSNPNSSSQVSPECAVQRTTYNENNDSIYENVTDQMLARRCTDYWD